MKKNTTSATYLSVFLAGTVISSGYADNGVPSIPPEGLSPGIHRQNNNMVPSDVKDPNLKDDTIQYKPNSNTGKPPDAEGLIFEPGTVETTDLPE